MNIKKGDWVEGCNLMPGIVQKIDGDSIELYQPHLAHGNPDYIGGSVCSKEHCGIVKIDFEYAAKLLTLGQDRVTEIFYKSSMDNYKSNIEVTYNKLIG